MVYNLGFHAHCKLPRTAPFAKMVAICRDSRPYSSIKFNDWSTKDTLVRDVCIIGSGSTVTFSAIRLRDQGKSVAVVEHKSRLGGHTRSYQDPRSGLRTEAGVVVIRWSRVAEEYFARFQIPLVKFAPPTPEKTLHADFTTGKPVHVTSSDP